MGQERQCFQGKWPAVPPWGRDDMRMRAQTQNSSFDRAEEYLRRVAQLTGAKQITGCVTDSWSGGDTSWWTANSCVSSHTIANRLAFPLGQTQMSPAQK